MKGLRSMRLGLVGAAAVALLAVGGFLLASQAAATNGTLSIGSATMAPGATGSVELRSNVDAPGLGAWTVDIAFTHSVVEIPATLPDGSDACDTSASNSVCNPAYTATQVRVTGASATGLRGDKLLAKISFHCLTAGTSPLTITTNVYADATIGAPANITPTITSGTITCAVPVATATPLPTLVVTGNGPAADGGMGYSWLIALLAAVGIAGLAGYSVLRLRARVR